jgi:Pilus assembly protein, PilO
VRRRQELIIFVAAALVVAVAVYALAIRPKGGEVADAHADAQAASSQAQTLQADIKGLEAIRANAVPLQTRERAVTDLFPAGPALPDLVDGLQRVADQSGVDLTAVRPSAPAASTEQPSLAQVAVGVNVTGTYIEVQDFLLRLENMVKNPDPSLRIPPRALLVQSVSLAKATGGATGGSGGSAAPAAASAPSNPDALSADIRLVAFEAVKLPTTLSSGSSAAGAGAAAGSTAVPSS